MNTNTTKEAARFEGAVYEDVQADIGNNRSKECVVRLDLTYADTRSPKTYTLILSVDAAISLRNQLDGLFAAAGIEDGGAADEDDKR